MGVSSHLNSVSVFLSPPMIFTRKASVAAFAPLEKCALAYMEPTTGERVPMEAADNAVVPLPNPN